MTKDYGKKAKRVSQMRRRSGLKSSKGKIGSCGRTQERLGLKIFSKRSHIPSFKARGSTIGWYQITTGIVGREEIGVGCLTYGVDFKK